MRKRLGLRQIAVAKALGISRPALSAYEQGGNLRPEIVERLCHLIDDKVIELSNSGGLGWQKKGSQLDGKDCRENRDALKISQRELAGKAGISQAMISLFE